MNRERRGGGRVDWPSFSVGAAVGGGAVYLLVSVVNLLAQAFA